MNCGFWVGASVAEAANLSRSTVTVYLGEMERSGLIQMTYKHIKIVDLPGVLAFCT